MGSRVFHVIFHCQNDASRSRFFVHKTPGFRISSAWAQMRKDRLRWIGLLNLIASLASTLGGPRYIGRRNKCWKSGRFLEPLVVVSWPTPAWREKNWMGRPARSCPTGFSPSSASSSSHLRSQAQNFTEAPTFSIVCCLHLPALFVFLRKIQMRHELESKMRKNQRKLEMQYSFTSLRGGQLRSISIPWTVTSHWKDERKNYRLDESSSSCTQDCCSKRLMRTEHTNI